MLRNGSLRIGWKRGCFFRFTETHMSRSERFLNSSWSCQRRSVDDCGIYSSASPSTFFVTNNTSTRLHSLRLFSTQHQHQHQQQEQEQQLGGGEREREEDDERKRSDGKQDHGNDRNRSSKLLLAFTGMVLPTWWLGRGFGKGEEEEEEEHLIINRSLLSSTHPPPSQEGRWMFFSSLHFSSSSSSSLPFLLPQEQKLIVQKDKEGGNEEEADDLVVSPSPEQDQLLDPSQLKRVATIVEIKPESESLWSLLLGTDALLFYLAAAATLASAISGIYCASEASRILDVLRAVGGSPSSGEGGGGGNEVLKRLFTILKESKGAVFLGLTGFLLDFASNVLLSLSAERLASRLRIRLFSSIIRQEIAFFDSTSSGELINRLSHDVSETKRAFKHIVSSGIRNSTSVIGGLVTLHRTSARLTFIMVGLVIAIYAIGNIYAASLRKIHREIRDAAALSTSIASETIANIRTVRAFANEPREEERYDQQLDNDLRLSRKLSFALGLFQGLQGLVIKGLGLVVLVYGGNLVAAGDLTMGSLASFVLHSLQLNRSAEELSILYTELGRHPSLWLPFFSTSPPDIFLYTILPFIKRTSDSTQRVLELIQRTPLPPTGAKLQSINGHIEFKNVTFRYSNRPNVDVLQNFNLTIPAGNAVAIVGKSGAGKSTILSLIERFYEPVNGTILLDGVPISKLDPSWLRSRIAIVSQEPVLFATTILENIKYGSPTASPQEVEEASKMANCHEFIATLPEKYETSVGERGVALSGGQRQRIAIARAILMNPRILILDEATSALDVESEAKVQEAIERLMEGRTVIIISHRWNTVKNADDIVVLKHGKVVEHGNHSQLERKEGGLYASMVAKQRGSH